MLIRLRSNRVLYGAPPPYTGTGRPRKHGDKFKLNDPSSWWQPDEEQSVEDDKWGQLRLQIWHDLHLRQAAKQGLFLIRVESVSSSTATPLKPLWLIWVGLELPQLATVWQQYLRRFRLITGIALLSNAYIGSCLSCLPQKRRNVGAT